MTPMNTFYMNGYLWSVKFVNPYSELLIDRTGTRTVATTDPTTLTVYLSTALHGDFLTRVLIHEMAHCAIFSFNLDKDIHRMVYGKYWIEAEEWVCNFIADYGMRIFSAAYQVLGSKALIFVPKELERFVS